MVKSLAPLAASTALLLAVASAASVPDGTWPTSTGTVRYSKAYTVKAGEVFDGKMQTFDRSDITCEGQTESGSSTAVFLVEAGGTLKNVIIGKNQMEGVHCDKHDCTIENVWWDDVCEDALSIKGGSASSVSTVIGGGARNADDKVIQHNGFGTVKIDGFYGEDISKLYRSCGTCGDKQRNVDVSNVYVVNPTNAIVTVNKNYNDQATLKNIWVKSSKSKKAKICQWSQGNANGEPTIIGNGPSGTLCQYSESDVHIDEDISQAASTATGSSNPTEQASSASTSTEQASSASASSPSTSSQNEGENEDQTVAASTTASASSSTTQTTTSTGSIPDGTWPASTGTVRYSEPYTIKAGEVFDGKMQTFERSDITCSEGEGQKDTAVFLVEAGGTLKNAIIGKDQKEGVHCDDHDCTIENVWWNDVCEDALSIKGGSASSVTTVTNCGARYASDKVVQHNGYGTVKINGFYAQEFGKLYRSCGTCGDIPRVVTVDNVYAVDPLVSVITVNKNYNDQATLRNVYVKTSDGSNDVKVCQWSQGSKTPSNLGDGPSGSLCNYSENDVHINTELPSTTTQTASSSSASTETSSADAAAAGTVAPADDDVSFDQSGASVASSTDTEQDTTEESTDAPSTSSSSASATFDVSQTAVQQSSVPSSTPASADTDSDNVAQNEDQTVDISSSSNTNNNGSSASAAFSSIASTASSGNTAQSTTASASPSTEQTDQTNSTGSVPDGTWPTSTGTVRYSKAYTVKAGEVFDGKMQTFDRSDITCEGQTESGSSTAVFLVEAGGTLKNVIIGKNQMEGVHCDKHDCTIENVWWDDVCEDALSIKGGSASSVSTVIGGGARNADDKVIQHNGFGTVKIDGFYGEDISKLYRSCGTCGDKQRNVDVSNVYVVSPTNAIVTVNKNYNDQATLKNIHVKSNGSKAVKICQWSQGNADGEPTIIGNGPSGTLCQYSESDVFVIQ